MRSKRKKYYVVIEGYTRGIFDNWDDCKDCVNGYKRAVYKGFYDGKDALDYILDEMDYDGNYVICKRGNIRRFNELLPFLEEAQRLLG